MHRHQQAHGMIMNISTSEGVKSVSEYVPTPEYAAMIRRRREAAARLGITPQQRETIRRSKSWTPESGNTKFQDRKPDPYEHRFEVRGAPN
jgi:hypothetical protein